MFNGEDMGCEDMGCEDMGKIRIRAGSDISPRSRQMKGAARQPRAYGTNPAITPKLAPSFPFPSEALVQRPHAESTAGSSQAAAAVTIYAVAFVTGAIVMSFEMLGSRYLNPYFGSGIYTWAALISTVLIALMAGYFLGGTLADRTASPAVLALTVIIGSLYLLALPAFAQAILEFVLAGVDDIRAGSLISALALMFFPVTFLGMYSPFAIRLLLRSAQRSGRVSGAVYGISTAGAIVGTLGTTFFLIPTIGSRAITLTLGALGLAAGSALLALARLHRRAGAALVVIALAAPTAPAGRADNLIDEGVRVAMLERGDGRLAHIETPYNDVFITKRQHQLVMSFQLKGWDYTESVSNLLDPDDLPLRYAQVMTIATVYPEAPRKILMLGLGGGSISTYLGRFMPEAAITTVEIDPGVITAAKTYFGLRETERMRYHAGDGRVFLNRNSEPYDLILLDAYRGGYVPFHLLTREFYTLVKQRLTPGGAAAFNVHDGSKLYASTVKTLGEVFAALDLYPTGVGEVIAVARTSPLDPQTLERRAAALQQRHGFRFPLPQILQRRMDKPQSQAANGDVITDDFAPADVYDVMGKDPRRRR
jgi:predicted membrane-bound spermidine synthase